MKTKVVMDSGRLTGYGTACSEYNSRQSCLLLSEERERYV